MGGKRKSPGRPPVVDGAAKVAMLAALREGRRLGEVAAAYGVTLQAFYSARRRDPLFAAAWRDAHALSAEAERRVPLHQPTAGHAQVTAAPGSCQPFRGKGGLSIPRDELGEDKIVPNNRRAMQRRRLRHVRFDERRKGIFLAAFARSCDLLAAAAAAGVCERTVHNHVQSDPAFAEAFQAALESGYGWLEAEAVRQRLEAQERLRAAIEAAEADGADGAPLALAGEGAEFDRTLRLLARWERRGGRLGWREVGRGRRRPWTFEQAMAALESRMRALGLRTGAPPPEEGG